MFSSDSVAVAISLTGTRRTQRPLTNMLSLLRWLTSHSQAENLLWRQWRQFFAFLHSFFFVSYPTLIYSTTYLFRIKQAAVEYMYYMWKTPSLTWNSDTCQVISARWPSSCWVLASSLPVIAIGPDLQRWRVPACPPFAFVSELRQLFLCNQTGESPIALSRADTLQPT